MNISISLEYWAFEILVLLGGLMPNSQLTTSLVAMWWVHVSFISSQVNYNWLCKLKLCAVWMQKQFATWSPMALVLQSGMHSFSVLIKYWSFWGGNEMWICSTRVGNELGAGNPGVARQAARVGLQLNGGLAVCVVLCVYFGHDVWAASFSSSPLIMKAFSSITPLLMASVFCDFLQGILSGLIRSYKL